MVPQPLEGYEMPVYELGTYKIVFNTDDMCHGGSGYPTATDMNGCFEAIDEPLNGKPYKVKINLPPLAGIFFTKVKDPVKKRAKKAVSKTADKKPVEKKTAAKPAAKKTTKAAPKKAVKSAEAKPAKKTAAKKPAASRKAETKKTK